MQQSKSSRISRFRFLEGKKKRKIGLFFAQIVHYFRWKHNLSAIFDTSVDSNSFVRSASLSKGTTHLIFDVSDASKSLQMSEFKGAWYLSRRLQNHILRHPDNKCQVLFVVIHSLDHAQNLKPLWLLSWNAYLLCSVTSKTLNPKSLSAVKLSKE